VKGAPGLFCRFWFNSPEGRTTADKDFAQVELRERERALARLYGRVETLPAGLKPGASTAAVGSCRLELRLFRLSAGWLDSG